MNKLYCSKAGSVRTSPQSTREERIEGVVHGHSTSQNSTFSPGKDRQSTIEYPLSIETHPSSMLNDPSTNVKNFKRIVGDRAPSQLSVSELQSSLSTVGILTGPSTPRHTMELQLQTLLNMIPEDKHHESNKQSRGSVRKIPKNSSQNKKSGGKVISNSNGKLYTFHELLTSTSTINTKYFLNSTSHVSPLHYIIFVLMKKHMLLKNLTRVFIFNLTCRYIYSAQCF